MLFNFDLIIILALCGRPHNMLALGRHIYINV